MSEQHQRATDLFSDSIRPHHMSANYADYPYSVMNLIPYNDSKQ